MAKKGVLSQGTHVWILHGDTPTLTKMDCVKAFVMGDDSTTEINTTCLEEPKTATSDWGLTTPGEGSIQIDTDPKNLSHMKLLELAADRAEVGVYVGWSDGEGVPTVGVDDEVLMPPTRTWSYFRAILRKGSPVFDADSLVNHTVPMKRQTEVTDEFKVVTGG
jgi:hypothetical protein